MADFGVNSTALSDPQGRGTEPLSPVQEQVSRVGISPVFAELGDIFAKGLKQNSKEEAERRKTAIVGEYINNEKVYGDALTTGQWNASQVSVASRANFMKMLAAYPEYAQELTQARTSVYGGSEVGEAQKRVDAEQKQVETDIASASQRGFVFYSGMSDDARNAQLEAYKAGVRVEDQWKKDRERIKAKYEDNTEGRSAGQYQMSVDTYVAKQNAAAGAREVAAKNFDAINTSFKDLEAKMAKGMPYEQAVAIHSGNINRIKAGLLAISDANPEMAAPWVKLFDDMDTNIKQMLDPKAKTADERKMLEDQYAILINKAKLAAVESNPRLAKAVVATNLFPGEGMVTLTNAPVVKEWLLDASSTDPKTPQPAQVVGTKDDAEVFNATKKAINSLQSGKVVNKEAATQEAVKLVNTLLEQTTKADGSLDPRALKQASSFYSSTEFGRMALEGKIDKQTAANAQHVFQVQYDPVVKDAIVSKLTDAKVLDAVNVKTVGGQVVFELKRKDVNVVDATLGALNPFNVQSNLDKGSTNYDAKSLKDAEAGLNQLIRMHAHLEGTTDYAKYWEANKHILMPNIFPDPAKLKPGQTVDGYKYIGGNYRDRSNWIAEPVKPKQ